MKFERSPSVGNEHDTETRAGILTLTETEYGSLDPQKLARVRTLLLDRAEKPCPPYLIVDLSTVQFFGASFIGILVAAWDRLRKRGRKLVLCGLTTYCSNLIMMLQLDKLFAIYPTRLIALEAIGQRASDFAEAAPSPSIRVRKSDVDWDPRFVRLEYVGEDNVPFRSIILPRKAMNGRHETPECEP